MNSKMVGPVLHAGSCTGHTCVIGLQTLDHQTFFSEKVLELIRTDEMADTHGNEERTRLLLHEFRQAVGP